MDENNQSGIAGVNDPNALELLSTGLKSGKPTRVHLRRNCRNTKEIVHDVQLWTRADLGRTEVTGFGSKPQVVAIPNVAALAPAVTELLRRLLSDGVAPEEIAVITPLGFPASFIAELQSDLRRLLIPLDSTTVVANLAGRIVWGPVDRFKGLEKPIVLVVGFDSLTSDSEIAQFYVATTRANYGLWIFSVPTLSTNLRDAQLQNAATASAEAR